MMNFQTNAINQTLCILRVGNYLKNHENMKQNRIPNHTQPFTKFLTHIVFNLFLIMYSFFNFRLLHPVILISKITRTTLYQPLGYLSNCCVYYKIILLQVCN